MSQHISLFQNQLSDLLTSVGITDVEFEAEQTSLSLLVDERFAVHFDLVNDDMWTIQAESAAQQPCNAQQAHDWLALNGCHGVRHQPVIALERGGKPYCWIGLPLQDIGPVARYEALDSVLALADELSDAASSGGPHSLMGAADVNCIA